MSFLKWEGCQNCNNKKVEQIIIAEKENGQNLRHYWSAVRRSREWNKPLFMRKYAVCAFTPSPCIKRIWLQKPVKSKDFLTVIPFGKKRNVEQNVVADYCFILLEQALIYEKGYAFISPNATEHLTKLITLLCYNVLIFHLFIYKVA